MSRHPDNPWWSQESDAPITVTTREQWDEAEANGHITPEHVLLRLEAMLRVAVGEPTDGGAAYDEDGFVRALVAAGWAGEGWRVQLHPNDHEPPHVHFWDKGDPRRQIRLDISTGQPLEGETVAPAVRKKLGKATHFIQSNHDLLMSHWNEAQA